MDLVIDAGGRVFNTDAIHPGDFVRAKYAGWNEARNGIVVHVDAAEVRAIWTPNIRNVTNFFTILAEEVEAGSWDVKWSSDMETINTHSGGAGG